VPDPVDRRDRLALVNTVLAARRYFLDGATKSEIANELGLSRFKVARLLDDALRDGIVRIEIDAVPEVDEVLSRELAVALAIRSAVVVRTVEGPGEFQRSQLGRAAASVLADSLDDDDVLGISWGRTLHSMIGHMPQLPGCAVVQIVGIVPSLELNVNSLELVRGLAARAGGAVYPLPVPLIVEDAAVAASLRADPHVARTIAMFPKVTRALVGIGAWTMGGSTLRASLSDRDAAALDAAGAVADCCSVVLDAEGQEVRAAGIPDRCIAISGDELRQVPDVVALSAGEGKVEAIRAALRSGLIHRLVTSEGTARALLAGRPIASRAS
jgi:DNA-binding transcriptional regulator LsrR (DeoR family)